MGKWGQCAWVQFPAATPTAKNTPSLHREIYLQKRLFLSWAHRARLISKGIHSLEFPLVHVSISQCS